MKASKFVYLYKYILILVQLKYLDLFGFKILILILKSTIAKLNLIYILYINKFIH